MINNCENCHHFNFLIDFQEGMFYQCLRGNNLWEKCNDYDPIELNGEDENDCKDG